MKKNILFLLLIVFTISSFASNNRTNNRCIKNKNLFVIQGSNSNNCIRIPVPDSLNLKSVASTNIVVNYHDFSVSAKKAFQYAVDIWSNLIYSPQTIYIDAYWKKLGTNVLGSCGPTNYYMNYDGFLLDSVYFPSALAEKLADTTFNDAGEPDLIANFSSDAAWYYGTDGKTPAGKYDLVSVVLHEMCHGLGFSGGIDVNKETNIATWGWGTPYPIMFDHFLTDQATNSILDTLLYPNNSSKLKTAVTAGEVYFSGPYLLSTYGKRVTMYTPTTWDDGSSVYHVNTTYTGSDRLMEPVIDPQTSIHDPGTIAQSILGDIGWKTINIKHEKIKNSEQIADAKITIVLSNEFSSSYIDPYLHYSIDSSAYTDVKLESDLLNKSMFKGTIPISKASNVSYYITVKDKIGRSFKKPVSAPSESYSFYFGPDTIVPTIKHYSNSFLLKGQDSIIFEANVTDAFGVKNVWVEYRYNGGDFKNLAMTNTEKNKFSAKLDLSGYKLNVNDSIEYRIAASDVSKDENTGYFPSENYIVMKVEEIPDFIAEYQNNFDGSGHDFILQGFEVNTANGFESGALNTKHPYEFAGDNSSLNYIAQLRYPIKVADNLHFINFDEIALVEPGEAGTVYGDENFYDYVVVEGSKDQGKTWKAFEPGWDCRRNADWEKVYTESVISQYSQAIGTPSLFRNHLIDLTSSGDFVANDTVLVRFRLYSDPFAYGWGWAIDNLKIQTKNVSSRDLATKSQIKIYPNPVTDGYIYLNSGKQQGKLCVSIFDMQGRKLLTVPNINPNGSVQLPDDLKGFYFIGVESTLGTQYFKVMVK